MKKKKENLDIKEVQETETLKEDKKEEAPKFDPSLPENKQRWLR